MMNNYAYLDHSIGYARVTLSSYYHPPGGGMDV